MANDVLDNDTVKVSDQTKAFEEAIENPIDDEARLFCADATM